MLKFSRQQFILLAVILTLGITPSQAKLGERLDMCVSSYGRPLSDVNPARGDGGHLFQKNEFTIEVLVIKGVIISEMIQKTDKSLFTEKERTALLEEAGGKWIKNIRRSNQKLESWDRDDGATASCLNEPAGMWLVAGLSLWPH